MALLKEDSAFTHVIAIDFGTGASGYQFFNLAMLLLLKIQTKTAKFALKCLAHAMAVMIKKHPQQFCSIMMEISLILVRTHSKNTQK